MNLRALGHLVVKGSSFEADQSFSDSLDSPAGSGYRKPLLINDLFRYGECRQAISTENSILAVAKIMVYVKIVVEMTILFNKNR